MGYGSIGRGNGLCRGALSGFVGLMVGRGGGWCRGLVDACRGRLTKEV